MFIMGGNKKSRRDNNSSFILFLKGLLMGFCDIIPGVSGGTIALIVGIYERLIEGINNININFVVHYIRYLLNKDKKLLKKSKDEFFRIDFKFFIPLGIGLVFALGLGSIIIPSVLNNFPVYTFAFFTGLILASIRIVYHRRIKNPKKTDFTFFIIGVIIAAVIVFMNSLQTNHSLVMIFVSGAIAISAMILPGISGSFILLLLGQYEYMLNVIHNISSSLTEFFTFIAGILVGLFSFVRLVSFLFKKYHNRTVLFLIGLMVGSLVLPLKNIIFVNQLYPDVSFSFGAIELIVIHLFIFIGVIVVRTISKFEK